MPTSTDREKAKRLKRTLHQLCRAHLDHAKRHKRSSKRDEGVLKKLEAFLPDKPLAEVSAWDIERDKAHSIKMTPKATAER